MRKILTILPAFLIAAAVPAHASTLDTIKSRGELNCGVSTGVPGFSIPDEKGAWRGFDVDYCHAVAAAIFGDPDKVKFTPLTAKDRLTAVQSGEVDVLYRNTTWTMSRDIGLGIAFGVVTYYDGQGFIVRKSMNIKSARELNGASICVGTGTTTELNLADYFRANNMKFDPVVFVDADEALKAYDSGRCDVYTTDASGLYAYRLKFRNPNDHVVLPEIISKEPLGPAWRKGDEQWGDIVKWVQFALVTAEELGITKENVDEALKSDKRPDVLRLLGKEGNFGEQFGLTKDWAYRVIKAVGNYGEMFDRNIGEKTPLGIRRGLNALWTKGGLQYAPPIR